MNGCERWVLCCHARLPEGRRYAVGHETKGIMTENRNILALDASKIGKRAYRKWLFWLSGLHPDDLIFSRCPCPCILVIKKQMGGSTTLFLTHFCPTLTPRHHGANYGLHARAAQQRHCPSRQRCASHQGAVSAAGCRGCVGLSLCQGLVARQKDPALEKRLAGETPAGWNSFYQMFVYFFFGSSSRVGFELLCGRLEVQIPSSYGPTPRPMPLAPRISIPRWAACCWPPHGIAWRPCCRSGALRMRRTPPSRCSWEGPMRPLQWHRWLTRRCGMKKPTVKMRRVTEICWTWRKTTSCFVYAAVHPEKSWKWFSWSLQHHCQAGQTYANVFRV